MKVFTKMCNLFDDLNYHIIQTNHNEFSTYSTYNHSNLYLINIIPLNDSYTYPKDMINEFTDKISHNVNNVNANKIIILNLLISNDTSRIVEENNYTPDFDEPIIEINWIIHDNLEQLIIPDKQVKDVIGIQKSINKTLKADDNGYRINKIQENNEKPYLTYILIVINILVFINMEISGGTTNNYNLVKFGAIDAFSFFKKGEYYRMITSMFIHIGFTHLFFNCCSLYILGIRLEKYMKKWQYLILYIMSGIIGGLTSITIDMLNNRVIISAGASGAIYGILGAILIYSYIYKTQIGELSYYIIILMLIIGIAIGCMNTSISNNAHIGGFVGGSLIAYIYSLKHRKTKN